MLFDLIAEKMLLPAWDRITGNNAARLQSEVRPFVDWDAERVREFQLDRIRNICKNAYENTDFYRHRFDDIGLKSFNDLSWEQFQRTPALTKKELREDLPLLMSKRHPESSLRKSATGGTTNSPTTIYLDWPANDRRWAATYEWDRRIGFVRGRKAAYLWGAQQDFDQSLTWKSWFLNQFVTRRKFFASSPLDDETMAEYYQTLKRWKPNSLQAYPTPLAIFSDFLLRKNLRLEIPTISVTAEPLQSDHAELIRKAFGRSPYNWYGAREAGRIATECQQHAGMHINSYGLFVEVDADIDYGELGLGRILITDLWNVGMPIIRYDIGDVGAIEIDACACGIKLPRITKLDGRTTDVFVNSVGRKIPGIAFTNRIVRDNSEIREMQFIQIAIGRFDVLVVPGEGWRGEDSKFAISRKLSEFMQEPTEATVSLVDSIPREQSGKVRFCRSLLAN